MQSGVQGQRPWPSSPILREKQTPGSAALPAYQRKPHRTYAKEREVFPIKEPQRIPITTEYIKLEALLKLANVVGSGGEAKVLIQEGEVSVNGAVCTMRGKKLRPGDRVSFQGQELLVQ